MYGGDNALALSRRCLLGRYGFPCRVEEFVHELDINPSQKPIKKTRSFLRRYARHLVYNVRCDLYRTGDRVSRANRFWSNKSYIYMLCTSVLLLRSSIRRRSRAYTYPYLFFIRKMFIYNLFSLTISKCAETNIINMNDMIGGRNPLATTSYKFVILFIYMINEKSYCNKSRDQFLLRRRSEFSGRTWVDIFFIRGFVWESSW